MHRVRCERSQPLDRITSAIHQVRGLRVMIDMDLAALYGVETKALNRAVKRNRQRFPADFMFQLAAGEAASLRCQSGTSNSRGGRRYRPFAFTEHGVLMLSSVLNSPRAVAVNIQIVRVFVSLRQMALGTVELGKRLDALEAELTQQRNSADKHFHVIFDTLRRLLDEQEAQPPPARIGFRLRSSSTAYRV